MPPELKTLKPHFLQSNNIDIRSWSAQGRFLRYRDYQVFYRDTAEENKPVLLLIHGFPSASIDWHLCWSSLNQRFRLVALDMMGFGLSDKPKDYPYSIFDQANIFEHLLQQLKIDQVHVLAHDYGDTVAQELLSRRLEQKAQCDYQSFIFLNGGLFPETHKPVLLQRLLISPLGKYLVRLNSYKKFKKTFDKICLGNMPEQELSLFWQLLNLKDGHGVMPKLINYMTERKQHRSRWVGALQNSDVPLRVIDGIGDPISGLHMVERYRELVTNPDAVELVGIGHYPQIEAPQQLVAAAEEFWQRINAS